MSSDTFDNDSSVGANAKQVLNTAMERGFDVGLATMSCEKDFIIRLVAQMVFYLIRELCSFLSYLLYCHINEFVEPFELVCKESINAVQVHEPKL